jgi:hypothetical protein
MTTALDCGTIRRIGPVEVSIGAHTADWTGDPTGMGLRALALDGVFVNPVSGRQLLEFTDNSEARIAYGDAVGVLAWIDTYGKYSDLRGFALITSFVYTDGPANDASDVGWGPFSMSALMVGDEHIVVVHSARRRENDFGLTLGRSMVVQPFWAEDPAEAFEYAPAGQTVAWTREYDDRTDHDPAAPSNDSNYLQIYGGSVA